MEGGTSRYYLLTIGVKMITVACVGFEETERRAHTRCTHALRKNNSMCRMRTSSLVWGGGKKRFF